MINEKNNEVCLSIVSHGQGSLVKSLLDDLLVLRDQISEVLVTLNISEDEAFIEDFLGHLPIRVLRNIQPKGFGANHNAAFEKSRSNWFVVVNPDIRINSLNFQELLSPFESHSVATVAPIVTDLNGKVEDSARRFPTIFRFAKRVLLRRRGSDYQVQAEPYPVDWVAGMFVVFRREAFIQIGGFDDRRYFMYLEDADICRRLTKNGWKILVNPNVQVIHLAQRASRKKLKYMRWHILSALRFLTGL